MTAKNCVAILVLTLALTAALAVSAPASRADDYPARVVKIVVPFPAGGSTDAISRIVGEPMRRLLGQPIIIENVSGADGSIGVGRAAEAYPVDSGFPRCSVLSDRIGAVARADIDGEGAVARGIVASAARLG